MLPVYAAALIVFFEGLVLWAVYPVTAFYCAQFGGGPTSVGVMLALLSLPKIFTNPVFGRAADRFGRRPLLIIASTGTLCGSVAWALSPSLGWLAVSRLVAGVFSAQSALCQTVVADATPPERRAVGLGVVGAAFGGSMVVGPFIGGWVAQHISHAAVGWVCAGIQLLSVLTAAFVLPETRPVHVGDLAHDSSVALRAVLRTRHVLPLLLATFVTAVVAAQLITTLSLLTSQRFGYEEEGASAAYAFFGVIALVVQGGAVRVIVPRWGERTTAIAGLAALSTGFALLALRPPESVHARAAIPCNLRPANRLNLLSRRLGQKSPDRERGKW